MTVQSRTRIRTATASAWVTDNPILSEGECGVESDTMKLKCGNGVDAWNTLIYVNQAIISTVGLTGVYSDLTGKPTLGTAAATAIGDYATASQGATANSALQPGGSGSSLTGITKPQVGLGNVDNTTDAGKPVSTAQQTALDAKQASSAKGQPNGYADLDGSGLVPVAQLPGIPAAWGAITGTLSAQTDLQAALDAKQASGSYATGTGTANGTNTGDQTSIVGITGTIAQFNTALSDGNFATGGGTVTGASSGTNTGDQVNISGNAETVTTNANLTGHVTSTGNAAVLGSFTLAQLNTAVSDANVASGGGTCTGTDSGTNTGDNATNTQYSGLAASKQDTLVSATNIKTINGSTVLGSGDLVVGGAVAWGSITGTLSAQTDLQTALNAKQATLVSATNIKTINGSTVLGSGDLTVSAGDPSYSPGSFTVATNTQRLAPHRIVLTTSQRITIEGTGRLSCLN